MELGLLDYLWTISMVPLFFYLFFEIYFYCVSCLWGTCYSMEKTFLKALATQINRIAERGQGSGSQPSPAEGSRACGCGPRQGLSFLSWREAWPSGFDSEQERIQKHPPARLGSCSHPRKIQGEKKFMEASRSLFNSVWGLSEAWVRVCKDSVKHRLGIISVGCLPVTGPQELLRGSFRALDTMACGDKQFGGVYHSGGVIFSTE